MDSYKYGMVLYCGSTDPGDRGIPAQFGMVGKADRERSGSGKSTLLRMLGTLEPPDEGKIFLEGKDLSGLSDKRLSRIRRRRIGFIYQDYSLFPEFTAYENIAMLFHLDGKKENKSYIKEVMDTLGITKCRDKFPSEMSGGEQQRVALARGMCISPAIILADVSPSTE